MHEELHVGEWIRTVLMADTGPGGLFDPTATEVPSGVYRDPIPPDRQLPAIRFTPIVTQDVRGATAPTARIMVRVDMLIVYVRRGHGIAPLLTQVDRLDSLLHDSEGETDDVQIFKCIRIEPFDVVDSSRDSPEQYRHVGGIYRIHCQAK